MKKIDKEKLFFISYVIFLIGILLNSTKYNVIIPFTYVYHGLQIIGCILSIFKIILDLIDIYKSKGKYKFNYLMILYLIISFIIFIVTKDKTIVYFDIFVLSSYNINFNKILNVSLKTLVGTFIFVILSCLFGIIDDLLVLRDTLVRHSYGWASPNCLSLVIFVIINLYLYINKDKLNIKKIILLVLLIFISYLVTNSRMGVFSSILLVILFTINNYTNIIKIIFNKLKILFYILPVILSIGFIILSYAYNKYQLYDLNNILSGRLHYSYSSISEYGIKPFGSDITFYGQGLESEWEDGHPYNYVDCSYLKLLLNYGYIFIIFLNIFLIKLTKHSLDEKDYYLTIIILISEVYCFFDSWLFGIEFNPYLLLIGNMMYPISKIGKNKRTRQ